MKKIKEFIRKVKLFFSPKLIKTVILSTGVICNHYRYWNKEVIHIQHSMENRMHILNEEFWMFDENDKVCNAWVRLDKNYIGPNCEIESYFNFKQRQTTLTKGEMFYQDWVSYDIEPPDPTDDPEAYYHAD